MNRASILILFIILNFAALGIGSFLMGENPSENIWYLGLPKAPWTPPGWVFGFAWFTIMALFSLFMTLVFYNTQNKNKTILIYFIQLFFNISWNPVFFQFHQIVAALAILILLFSTLVLLLIQTQTINKATGFLVLPYLIWLMIAISLNLYPLIA